MNIGFDYIRGGEHYKPLALEIKLYTIETTLYCGQFTAEQHGSFSFAAKIPKTKMCLDISCQDTNIFHSPVILTCLHLDDFFHLASFAHHGMPVPSYQHDFEIEPLPGSALFFCGTLRYQLTGPTPQMVVPYIYATGEL